MLLGKYYYGDLKEILYQNVGSSISKYDPVAGCCEEVNKRSGSIKDGNCLD
jgi:hypothetical protein